MPPVIVDPAKVHEFIDAPAFSAWLAANHDREHEVWIRIHKVASGLPTITPAEAVEEVLCWGWIDAIRKGLDERSFLQRYTRRGPKSIWSKINVETVARLIAEGRMTEYGMRHVHAAKADGRWDRAYGGSRDLVIPEALMQAIAANPAARATFDTLSAQNRFALAFRLHNLKTEAGRARRIAVSVAMLARGETVYPQTRR